jgi:dynein heavy chain
LTQNILCKFPVFITGVTGVGKSIIIADAIKNLKETANHEGIFMSFSSQTAAKETQISIEEKLEKRRRNLLAGPHNRKVVLFIDDVNMPSYDLFGTQAPIELLRTLADFKFFYDRDTLEKKWVEDTTIVVAAAPPEGGRKVLTPRFTRHFHTLCLPPTQEDSLEMIFMQIMNGFLADFKSEIKGLAKNLV